MDVRLRAEYANVALRPLEPLDLQEGTLATLYIEEQSDNSGQQHNALEIADRVRQSGPEDTFDSLPTDGAQNFRNCQYGHPKEVN